MRGVSWKVRKQTLHYNVERACPYSRNETTPKSYPVACKEEDKKYIELSFTVFHGPQVQDFNGDFWLLVPTMDLPPPCHTQCSQTRPLQFGTGLSNWNQLVLILAGFGFFPGYFKKNI
ncbi:hypothetical protein AMTR_s00203p00034330 [Amborella trichopoda]|uniref:Uncharacterized protein n=1 Tax=Amborella trichopoda TaxID=13333 RepID=W1P7T1_AMBTC|nr:hypothetical protein AMTR_s00203p00034330 [Amborella trichopoda]